MYCDEKKVKEIIIQMTRLHNELLETTATLEEKKQALSALTKSHINTSINEINPKIENALDRLQMLIIELETKATSIMALNNLKGDNINNHLPIANINSSTINNSRFTMEITQEEAMNAITANLKNNREITKLVNSEIGKEKAVLK